MAGAPYDDRNGYQTGDADAPRERSVGEHVFIWVAWALAAAFWGATMTVLAGILRAAGAAGGISASGASGVSAYLVLVIVAFLAMAGALAYASVRSAHGRRDLKAMSDAGAAALYNSIERQGGEDMTSRSPDRGRPKREFR